MTALALQATLISHSITIIVHTRLYSLKIKVGKKVVATLHDHVLQSKLKKGSGFEGHQFGGYKAGELRSTRTF